MRRHAKALIAVFVAMLVLGASAAVALQTHPHEASRDLNGTEDFSGDPDTVPAGSFCCVNGLAVDQGNGDLYFAEGATPPDQIFGSIYRYDSSGAYQAVFNVSESLSNPQDVAIDSSGSGSDGTLYVADSGNNRVAAIDSTSGSLVAGFGTGGRINGAEDSPGDPDTTPTNGFSSPCGVAVDQSNGNLFVADNGNNRIWIFDSSGAYLGKVADSTLQGPCGIAFDSTNRLYVRNANDGKVLRFSRVSATEYNFDTVFYSAADGGASDVAVDPSNDNVYLTRGEQIAEYDSNGSPISTFGQDTACCGAGIAVDSTGGRIYASQSNVVRVFGPLVTLPGATTGSASAVTGTSATISGTIDPAGGPAASCQFEYGTDESYGQTAPCNPAGPFTSAEAVTAALSGLNPATTYHYRLHASNADGSANGEDRTFTTNGPPLINQFSVSEVSGSTATLNATVDPAGLDTSYRFEYVSEAEFQTNGFTNAAHAPVPDGVIDGSVSSPQEVSQDIAGLTPATSYRFRVVAENSVDDATSVARAFRTFPPQTSPSIGAFPGQGFLPDNRAWEMVSPPEKLGADINGVSARIRIAADGSAVSFSSLGGFADSQGTGVTVDYLSNRTGQSATNGWSTHAILPAQTPLSVNGVTVFIDPRYYGDFSPDLNRGVLFARSPVTDDPNVAEVPNLYLRTDMRSAGKGSYQLLTPCPLCAEQGKPLPPLKVVGLGGGRASPQLAGVTPDLSKVVFESRQRLTADTPEPLSCNFNHPFGVLGCSFQAYESDGEELHYVGRIPTAPATSCDDAGGPSCQGAAVSRLGSGVANGATESASMPNVISDGSSGHTTVFFTFPTNDGVSPNAGFGRSNPGKVYARIDNTRTVQLNASERTDCAGDPSCGGDNQPDPAPESFAPAYYLGASADGTRAFFGTEEALSDDAPAPIGGGVSTEKLYMYDLTKPASDPHNLTLLNADGEPGDGEYAALLGVIGYSKDGSYVYFEADGALRPGQPQGPGIYLWHEGTLTYIGSGERNTRSAGTVQPPGGLLMGNPNNLVINEWENFPRMSRVTADGRHLLFASNHGEGLLSVRGGVDHECIGSCLELYLYGADQDRLQCVSCNPTGEPTTVKGTGEVAGAADVVAGALGRGATRGDSHEPSALSADGRYVFFSSTERLVAADRNGPCKGISQFSDHVEEFPCTDAYVFDSETGEVHLLSSGESSAASVFIGATPDGRDALIATRERLSGWDFDGSYDIYDARVNGGLPEPPLPPSSCQGDACQPAPVALNDPTPSSSSFQGPGNKQARKPHKKKRHANRKGKHHKQGKKHKKQGNGKQKRSANENGRASR